MVDLVILDVNETLFPLDPIAARMAEVGLDGHLELWFTRVLRDGIAAAAAGRFASFPDLARHHVLELLRAHGQPESDTSVQRVLDGFHHVRPHADVEPGLQALRGAGIEVVALTNGVAGVTVGFLERAGLDELVQVVYEVTEAGRWKPAVESYGHVIEQRGVAADRTAMVAVHPWDVLGAQAAGLVGAWLDRDGARYPGAFGAPDLSAPDLVGLAGHLIALDVEA